jgi:hypothetical protein
MDRTETARERDRRSFAAVYRLAPRLFDEIAAAETKGCVDAIVSAADLSHLTPKQIECVYARVADIRREKPPHEEP